MCVVSVHSLCLPYRKVITQNHLHDRYKVLTYQEHEMLKKGQLKRKTAMKLCGGRNCDILVDIMVKFDMLVPHAGKNKGKRESGGEVEYVVPCLMKRVPEEDVSPKEDKSVPTLYYKFVQSDMMEDKEKRGFLSHGFFHRLVSRCCQTNENWTMDHFYCDYVDFSADSGVVGYLRMGYDSILLCVTDSAENLETKDQECEARSQVRENIESIFDDVIKDTCPNLTYVAYLECTSGHKHR